MEAWVPLFNIFLNSPTPETEASLWLEQSSSSSSVPITTTSFLSLLAEPIINNSSTNRWSKTHFPFHVISCFFYDSHFFFSLLTACVTGGSCFYKHCLFLSSPEFCPFLVLSIKGFASGTYLSWPGLC